MGAIHQALLMGHVAAGGGGATPEVEFDARSLLGADGSAISQWDDTSGNARHAVQASGSNQPIVKTGILNSNPVGRWDGGVKFLDFTGNAASASYTVIAVMKCTDGNPRTVLGSTVGNTTPQVRINSSLINLLRAGAVSLGSSSTSLSTSTFYTIGVTYDDVVGPGNFAFYLNGSADGTGTNQENFTDRFARIGMKDSSGEPFLGDIAYVAYWSSVLSGVDLTTIFADLRTVWAHY